MAQKSKKIESFQTGPKPPNDVTHPWTNFKDDPYFKEMTERAKAMFKKTGLPKEFLKKRS